MPDCSSKTLIMIYTTKKVIEVSDWDNLVMETYGRPYNFQQQEGCQSRGSVNIRIPDEVTEDELPDSIPEVINGRQMGVTFESWLKRDPKQPVGKETDEWSIELFWDRNFYPNIQMVANDLHKKGLIEAGDYVISIDW